jgi:DNA-binding MarR family transcriptional regulator
MRTVDPSVVPGPQLKVLRFVVEQMRDGGLSPSLEEIGGKLGYTRQAAHYHIKALGERGYIVRYRGRARSIKATTLGKNLIARYDREEQKRPFERSAIS